MRKLGIRLLIFGLGLAAMICTISITLYGKVYFFDGFEITKFGWIVSFLSIAVGAGLIFINKPIVLVCALIALIFLLLTTCCDGMGSSSKDKCAVCKGSGLVNYGFLDFHTCPVCNGTGVDFH